MQPEGSKSPERFLDIRANVSALGEARGQSKWAPGEKEEGYGPGDHGNGGKPRSPGSVPANDDDAVALREAVRHERQVELGFELHRYFDLVRWGIAAQLLPGFQVGKHEVFPLPQTELDLNPALMQNAGY